MAFLNLRRLKIKNILTFLFLLVCLSGCLPELPQERPSGRTEYHSSDDEFTQSEPQSTQNKRDTAHTIYKEQINKGQRIFDINIEYHKKLKKSNEQFLLKGVEINVSEVQRKQLQEAAKNRHFKNLEKLLEL